MKQLLFAAAALLLLGCLGSSGGQAASAPATSGLALAAPSASPAPSSPLTLADVAAHSSPSDCWVVVSGKVYDVTGVISQHPGGPEVITALCGGDATSAFNARGGRGEHPPKAQDKLGTLLVGSLSG